MVMVSRIFSNDKYHIIDPDKAPLTLRELDGFLAANTTAKCFLKSIDGWYKLQGGKILFVNRTLYTMSFKDWLEVAKNNNFTPNTR
jgi:hypothetical protein